MNCLHGTILAVEAHGTVAIVDVAVGALQLTATLLGSAQQLATWQAAQPVQMLFKETEVALAKNLQGQISLRNRLPGRIVEIEWGQLLTRVLVLLDDLAGVTISSVITTRSAKNLQLQVGDALEGLVKANEMSIMAGSANDGVVA
ncbi:MULTISPECIES: TOBE domain-containing protein [unclassified Undibacterium]|uniref:TOBE domain-containing protein n=2 Tax=Pseudomonadota TaxID=1224 RepID=UPI002AC9E28C|nr:MULTISPECIES: TOBE domain-containing protein [unclassified Undibacterium]MEB0137745.1 TOBE domain-containing protein [Undibacterium sp. CCC2.1]MEB0172813.1 TOBE domain-containing protein [Undibacterium sp. CCC1.1]MEB0176713.1 TOBE domain-containing protein [Undibacterium sp. CCC3.4]MEB0215961.1 TOBE domain-containing protein [Undibacterium sp. 5I2]WPX42320.1 TOBE domain-containing protein [Undibacterium sp. CCC3.4]